MSSCCDEQSISVNWQSTQQAVGMKPCGLFDSPLAGRLMYNTWHLWPTVILGKEATQS